MRQLTLFLFPDGLTTVYPYSAAHAQVMLPSTAQTTDWLAISTLQHSTEAAMITLPKTGNSIRSLGLPATNIAVPTAAQYARANGNLWFCNERVVFFITAVLKRIYSHNRSVSALTGGGCSLPANWKDDWGNYPYIPLSAGVELGDKTGTFSVNINDNGTTSVITGIPAFIGLKNDYKYLGAIEEDTLLLCEPDGTQSVWIDHNIDGHTFDVSKTAGKVMIGNTYQTGACRVDISQETEPAQPLYVPYREWWESLDWLWRWIL